MLFRLREPPPLAAVELDRKRKLVRPILERPTLSAKGPSESFFCKPDHYFWFLDHPDKAVTAWRKLGAKCVSITPRGKQQFAWADDQGSDGRAAQRIPVGTGADNLADADRPSARGPDGDRRDDHPGNRNAGTCPAEPSRKRWWS